jgi:hypothetical protein
VLMSSKHSISSQTFKIKMQIICRQSELILLICDRCTEAAQIGTNNKHTKRPISVIIFILETCFHIVEAVYIGFQPPS